MFLILVNIESVGNLKYTSDLQPVTSLKNELLRRYLLFLFFWKNIYFMEHLMFISCKTKLKQNFFFFEKIFVFFTKYTLFAEKNNFIWKKNFISIFFVYWKSFFYRKWKKYISHLRNIFLSRKYIFILQKKKNVFDHKKYIC